MKKRDVLLFSNGLFKTKLRGKKHLFRCRVQMPKTVMPLVHLKYTILNTFRRKPSHKKISSPSAPQAWNIRQVVDREYRLESTFRRPRAFYLVDIADGNGDFQLIWQPEEKVSPGLIAQFNDKLFAADNSFVPDTPDFVYFSPDFICGTPASSISCSFDNRCLPEPSLLVLPSPLLHATRQSSRSIFFPSEFK